MMITFRLIVFLVSALFACDAVCSNFSNLSNKWYEQKDAKGDEWMIIEMSRKKGGFLLRIAKMGIMECGIMRRGEVREQKIKRPESIAGFSDLESLKNFGVFQYFQNFFKENKGDIVIWSEENNKLYQHHKGINYYTFEDLSNQITKDKMVKEHKIEKKAEEKEGGFSDLVDTLGGMGME